MDHAGDITIGLVDIADWNRSTPSFLSEVPPSASITLSFIGPEPYLQELSQRVNSLCANVLVSMRFLTRQRDYSLGSARQPGHTDRENLDFDPILARMCPLDERRARRPHPNDMFEDVCRILRQCGRCDYLDLIQKHGFPQTNDGRVRKKEDSRQIERAMSLRPNYALIS